MPQTIWKLPQDQKDTWRKDLQTTCQKLEVAQVTLLHLAPVNQASVTDAGVWPCGNGPYRLIKWEARIWIVACFAYILKGKTISAFFLKLWNEGMNTSFLEVFLGKAWGTPKDSQGTIFCATAILLNIGHRVIRRRMGAVSLDAPQNRLRPSCSGGFTLESWAPRPRRRLTPSSQHWVWSRATVHAFCSYSTLSSATLTGT